MNSYSRGLNIISNNVSNLNTPGFKAAHARFSETDRSVGSGKVPQAQEHVGAGVQLDLTTTDFSQGELRASTGDLDLSVDGRGFLVLLDGDAPVYTRTGQFTVNEEGALVRGDTKLRLATLNDAGAPVAVNISAKRTDPPVATTNVKFAENLSSTGAEAIVSGINVYDALGAKSTWQAKFTPIGAASPGEWKMVVTNELGSEVATTNIRFIGGAVDTLSKTITITDSTRPGPSRDVVFDFSAVTSFSTGTTSTLRSTPDGAPFGALSTVTINDEGEVTLTYDNAKTASAGTLALASFRAPELLHSRGDGLYEANAADPARLSAMHPNAAGSIKSKASEASNVNLSQEFGELILLQRGFQASSQVVSITNEMIQQLFGIRGNG
jgi:flagellar hook protein FlgE